LQNENEKKERILTMGEFLDALNQVGKISSAGIGFLGRRVQAKPKPAVLIAALASVDSALAEAAMKGGAEAVLLPEPERRGSLAEWISAQGAAWEALRGGQAAVGLALSGDQTTLETDELEQAAQAGLDFVVLEMAAPVRLLSAAEDKLDKVVALSVPRDEVSSTFLRAANLLPVGAVLFEPVLEAGAVRALTLEEHVRYRLARESLRFAALATITGGLDAVGVKVLIGLGLQGLILRAAPDESPDHLRERVARLHRLLEETPKPEGTAGEVPSVGTLAGSPGLPQPQPQEPQPEP
jgi:hypothetical protein